MGAAEAPRRFVLAARAKINLGLEVLRKRPDGYHEIRTLMQSIGLADRLEFTPAPGGRLTLRCPGSDLPEDGRNLVLQAALHLRERSGAGLGAGIVLDKKIPIGAGLGGGSADAATTLIGLNRLWGLRLRRSELERIASRIASDVPFFVRGGTQLAEGRGEILTPLAPLPPLRVVVIYPTLFISTASIYRDERIPLTPSGPLSRLRTYDLTTRSGVVSCVAHLQNDLEEVVACRHRRVAELLRGLRDLSLPVARVSGSGSSVFVLCEDQEVLRKALCGVLTVDRQVFRTWFRRRGWVSVGSRGAGARSGG